MRRSVIALALAAALSLPIASGADDPGAGGDEEGAGSGGEASDAPSPEEAAAEPDEAEEGEEAEAEDEEPSWFAEYAGSVRTRALTGLNGLATAPADPVMATVEPPKAFAKASYLRRPLGFGSGVLLMLYRAFSGAVDLGLAIVPELPVVSPVPRFKPIPGFQHEDE
jgi:hypothetical protein